MDRKPGPSVRLKLTLSYVGVLVVTGAVLLAAVWVFLLRGRVRRLVVPSPSDFRRALDPHNFGPATFVAAAIMLLTVLLVVGLVGGWFLAGRMLAPLARITDAVRQAGTGSLSHRVELPGRKDELRELADAFDVMLARLDAQVAEQQRFAANASHELRTPLAITQTLLDVARDDPDRDSDVLDEKLRSVNRRAIELTEALLLLSRTEQRSFTHQPVDLSLLAEEATETLLPLAEERGVTLEAVGDVAMTSGSAALLLQMTTNLVHNAIVHNLGEDGRVDVTTTAGRGAAVLTVENTGGPIGPEQVATLTEPFQRGAARIRGDHQGTGLGLAIVKSIVSAHDGALSIAPREGGGLRACVTLPSGRPGRAGGQAS